MNLRILLIASANTFSAGLHTSVILLSGLAIEQMLVMPSAKLHYNTLHGPIRVHKT